MRKTLFVLLGFVLLLSLLLGACGEEETTTSSVAPPSTTTSTTTSAPPSTTTAPTPTAPTGDKYGGIYQRATNVKLTQPLGYPPLGSAVSCDYAMPALELLVRRTTDGTLIPVLATSWKVAEDGRSITLNLRKGVKFHDGSDFNADVCKWNMDLAIAAKQPGAKYWKSIDKVDDYTIRINTEKFVNIMLADLTISTNQMISKASFDKNGIEWCKENPVGTGPFIFVSHEPDFKIIYKRNPNYWDTGKPYLDGVEMPVIPDNTVQRLAFLAGDIHQYIARSLLDAKEMKESGKYQLVTEPGGPFVLIPDSMNPESPWSDVNVRYAASYALDRQAMADGLGYGFANPAYQFLENFDDSRIPDLVPTLYDPDKAKKLLRDAGYPNGFKSMIHVSGVPDEWITALTDQLREVGIILENDHVTRAAYQALRYGTWDGLMAQRISASGNKNAILVNNFTGIQFQYCKKPVGWQEGVDASLATPEPEPKLIQAVIQIMYDDMMIIPFIERLAFEFTLQGVHKTDVGVGVASAIRWAEIWLDKSIR